MSNSEVAAVANQVCSTPNNRHLPLKRTRPFGAKSGLVRRSKLSDYPISSSASESGSAGVAMHYALAACD
jgi:hypothetical protein